MNTTTSTLNRTAWMPCSGREEIAGCVWLPRMIQKARRKVESERAGRDLLHPYMFGGIDPLDKALKEFLRTTDDEVLALLRHEASDRRAAEEVIRRSGRTTDECAAWSASFLRGNAFQLAMFDADEERRPPGLTTTLLRLFYNHVLMPPVYWFARRAERKSRPGGLASTA